MDELQFRKLIEQSSQQPHQTVDKFDRARGGLKDVALFTKPSTIQTLATITGEANTFIVETCRHEDGDHVFIQAIDKDGVVRLHLPPRVCNIIASQRDSLSRRIKSAAARNAMKQRMANGFKPTFRRKTK